MKEFFSAEPTPHRMLIRFALAMGLLLLSAQLATLIPLNPANGIALIGFASIPALGVLIVETIVDSKRAKAREKPKRTKEDHSFRIS